MGKDLWVSLSVTVFWVSLWVTVCGSLPSSPGLLVTDCVNNQPSDASLPEDLRGAGRVVMGDCQGSVEDRLGDLQREVKELTERNKDLTEKNKDLTEKNNDLTQENVGFTGEYMEMETL